LKEACFIQKGALLGLLEDAKRIELVIGTEMFQIPWVRIESYARWLDQAAKKLQVEGYTAEEFEKYGENKLKQQDLLLTENQQRIVWLIDQAWDVLEECRTSYGDYLRFLTNDTREGNGQVEKIEKIDRDLENLKFIEDELKRLEDQIGR